MILKFILILLFILIGLLHLIKSAEKTFEKLNNLKYKVNQDKTKLELDDAWEELKIINKECWHHSFYLKVIEIKAIIQTKYHIFNNNI